MGSGWLVASLQMHGRRAYYVVTFIPTSIHWDIHPISYCPRAMGGCPLKAPSFSRAQLLHSRRVRANKKTWVDNGREIAWSWLATRTSGTPSSPPLQRPCQRAKLPYRAARRILTCLLRSRGSEDHHLQRSARVSCKDSQGYEAIVPPNPPPAHACWAGHIKRCHHQSVFGRRPRPQRPWRPSALRDSYTLNDDHSVSTLTRDHERGRRRRHGPVWHATRLLGPSHGYRIKAEG